MSGAALGPVVQVTRRAEVVIRLRRALLSGELQPGQRIKEPWLAEALGVSRPTIRESMQQLIHEGLLIAEPYKGVRVAAPTAAELRDLAEVRTPLETLAAMRLAADPHSPGRAQVRAALAAHLAAIERGDEVEVDMSHLDLHRTIWEQAGSPTLDNIWPLIGPRVQLALTVDQSLRRDPERDAELHIRLVEVIESGDAAEVVREVHRHILGAVEGIAEQLS